MDRLLDRGPYERSIRKIVRSMDCNPRIVQKVDCDRNRPIPWKGATGPCALEILSKPRKSTCTTVKGNGSKSKLYCHQRETELDTELEDRDRIRSCPGFF